jgi:hypothetical protein
MKETLLEKKIIEVLTATLKDIPFIKILSVKEESNVMNVGLVDASIRVKVGKGNPKLLVLEIKNSGQPRIIREAVNQLFRVQSKRPGSYGIIAAPYISPVSAAICKQEGIGYMDLAGNCRISFNEVYINREGIKNPFAVKRDLRSIYSPRAARVLRVLLNAPKQYWKVGPLAKEAAVSIGQIANVKKLLNNREWILEGEDGFRLTAPVELLTEWAENYSFRKNRVLDFYSMEDAATKEIELAHFCSDHKIPFALTGLSGAAHVHPGIRFQRAMVYIGAIDEKIISKFGLKSVATGANISILLPYDEGVFYKTTDYEGLPVVSPIQLYLDLKSFKGRGEEAAQTIFERILKPAWQ